MFVPRLIPTILMKDEGLYKGVQYKNHQYIGDPINTVRIFNEKEVDELVVLDIEATLKNINPNYAYIEEIASEAFMPVAYGGGIKTFKQAKTIFNIGIEKVILGSVVFETPKLIKEIADSFGSQSVVVSIDVKFDNNNRYLYSHCGLKKEKQDINEFLHICQEMGAGEILLNDISREGMQIGYDLDLIKSVSSKIRVPLVVSGGAWQYEHLKEALDAGADALSIGTMFVYHGKHKAVLISYPQYEQVVNLLREEK